MPSSPEDHRHAYMVVRGRETLVVEAERTTNRGQIFSGRESCSVSSVQSNRYQRACETHGPLLSCLQVVYLLGCALVAWSNHLLLAHPWFLERPWNWRRGSAASLLLIFSTIFWIMRAAGDLSGVFSLGSMIPLAIPSLLLVDACFGRSADPL